MIKLNDVFSFEQDPVISHHQWILYEVMYGEDKDGNYKPNTRNTYHANIGQVASTISDRLAGQCTSMESLIGLLESANTNLELYLKGAVHGAK